MIRETTVLILCIRLLAQISSTTSNELGPDPPNNLTNVHRYRRSQNDILEYFYLLNRETTHIHGSKAHPFLKFSEQIVYINNHKRRKLSCTANDRLIGSTNSFRGVLILHKKLGSDRLEKLVGVNAKGSKLWNKRMQWNENIGNKPLFTSRQVGSVSGFGEANLIIPETDCGNQAGGYACQIFSRSNSDQMKRYESSIYSLTKQQCLSKTKRRKKIKIITDHSSNWGGNNKKSPDGTNNKIKDYRHDVMIVKIPYVKTTEAATVIVGSCALFMIILVTTVVLVMYFSSDINQLIN